MRRWAATAAPAPRPRRAPEAAKAPKAQAEVGAMTPAGPTGEEAGAPGAVWTVRRKDMEDDMASDLVCFQARQRARHHR